MMLLWYSAAFVTLLLVALKLCIFPSMPWLVVWLPLILASIGFFVWILWLIVVLKGS